MKAIEIVKRRGLEFAYVLIEIADISENYDDHYYDLKKVVDAFELVKNFGGLIEAKAALKLLKSSIGICLYHRNKGLDIIPKLEYAVNLVEQCNESKQS